MESMNEILDTESYDQQMVIETTDFGLLEEHHTTSQESESECDGVEVDSKLNVSKPGRDINQQSVAVLSGVMETLIAKSTSHSKSRSRVNDDDEEESRSVVMVIDEMGHSNLQTTYQIVPQHIQVHGSRTMPMSLLPIHHHQDRNSINSPVGFSGADDISLDGLTTTPGSQAFNQAVKLEHKEDAIGNSRGNGPNRRSISQRLMDISSMSNIEELSSDGGVGIEEVTLNQHHQQILHHQQHNQSQHHAHHQQYGHRLAAESNHLVHHQRQQQQRSLQLEVGSHHREELSVIVQTHEEDDGEDVDEDEDDDDRDSGGEHLLSPVLAVDNCSLEQSTYQTLTSVNNRISSEPGYSPTSYATLTPIQPLPPISTMSDKFAYAGHISGNSANSSSGSVSNSTLTPRIIDTCGTGSTSDCGSFANLPITIEGAHQNSLAGLNLSGLGVAQSPFSSYDKLPSLISPPPHSYVSSSPSHGLPGMVGSCDLHTNSSPGRVTGHTCHSPLPHEHELISHSPRTRHGHEHTMLEQNHNQEARNQAPNLVPVVLQKQVICVSPGLVADDVVVSEFESTYSTHHHHHHDQELIMTTTSSTPTNSNSGSRSSQLRLHHSPTLSPHSVSTGSVVSMSLHSPTHSVVTLNTHINGSVTNFAVDLPAVGSLTPSPPPNDCSSIGANVVDDINQQERQEHQQQQQQHQLLQPNSRSNQSHLDENDSNHIQRTSISGSSINLNACNINNHHQHQSGFNNEQLQQQHKNLAAHSPKPSAMATMTCTGSSGNASSNLNTGNNNNRSSGSNDLEEINTKELAQRISAELKRYSIPQAIFAQRVLCRSQGTLSDLLRNPKPWSKLKSGRETFRRMFKWLQEPEFQRMSALRMAAAQIPQRQSTAISAAGSSSGGGSSGIGNVGFLTGSGSSTASTLVVANTNTEATHGSSVSENGILSLPTGSGIVAGSNCRRKEELHMEQMPQPKKPRLVFTDLQRRTLQAIFKETKRPSKEMQVTIARQLGLEPTTVGNFFMNARRRSMDKWRDDDTKNSQHPHSHRQHQEEEEEENPEESESNSAAQHGHYNSSSLHTTAMSPLGNFDDDGEMDLELEHHDFLVDHDHDGDHDANDDML